MNLDEKGSDLLENVAEARARPLLDIERVVGRRVGVVAEALVQRVEQPVFVREAAIEAADRRARFAGHLRDRYLIEALAHEQRLGGVEQAREARAGALLPRRTHPTQRSL